MKSRTIESVVRAEARGSFIDVTDELMRAIKDAGVTEGCAVAYCRHTTCGLLINEMEAGALDDLRRRLETLVPDGYFAHDDLDRRTQNLIP
ncbi:MAG: YjbQ family protein, partial [Actinomycetota bacterium]